MHLRGSTVCHPWWPSQMATLYWTYASCRWQVNLCLQAPADKDLGVIAEML